MPFVTEAFGAQPNIMAAAARELLNSIYWIRPGPGCGARRAAVLPAVTPMPPLCLEPFVRHVAGGRGTGTRGTARARAASTALVTGGCGRRRGQHGPARASKHGAK
jgi:hypothetical protein